MCCNPANGKVDLCGWRVDNSAPRLHTLCGWIVGPDQSPMEEEKENHCHFLAMVGVKWWSMSTSQALICAGASMGPLNTLGWEKKWQ